MKLRVLFYLIVPLFLLFAACSENVDESGKIEDDQKSESESTDSTTETDRSESAEKGGTLKVAFSNQPPTLDIPQTTATVAREISHLIYEPLVTLNSSLEVEPMLAETYDISDDGKEVTFHLRQGIKFHNGQEMTAEDVVVSMERWQELSSSAGTYLEGTTYEAIDESTVVAHIEDPTTIDMYIFADLSQFAAIMPKEVIENQEPEGVAEYIGTGPYKFEEWKQDQHIHLTKYEDFQSRSETPDGLAGEKKALVDEIYCYFVGDTSTRIAGLQTEEYHIIDSVPVDDAELLKDHDGVKNAVYSSSMLVIMLNNKSGFFADTKARQAVNVAFNVDDMLLASYVNEDYYTKNHALVAENQSEWHTDAGSDIYQTFDADLAKEMLEESGYDGEEIVILTFREREDLYNTAVVIEQQLKNVGVNATIDVRDAPTALELTEDETAWNIWIDVFAFRPVPIQQLFLNPNYMGWPDSETLSDLSDRILHSDTLEDAQQLSTEFHEAFWNEVPTIKVGDAPTILSMQENVDGLQYIAGPILWNVSIEE